MASDQVQRRLQELSERWNLPPRAPRQLEELLRLVAEEPLAITTVRDPEQAVELHIADSLSGLAVPQLRQAARIADLGSGGGFPGLVLAAALPEAQVSLVESVGKKASFLAAAAEGLELSNVEVLSKRAEEWGDGIESQDLVTARALAPLNVLVEYAAPLLRAGGGLLAWKGIRDAEEERDGAAAAADLGMQRYDVHRADDVRGANERWLHLYLKVRPTPARFPRRPGMARKRPLRASTEP